MCWITKSVVVIFGFGGIFGDLSISIRYHAFISLLYTSDRIKILNSQPCPLNFLFFHGIPVPAAFFSYKSG